jgi:hypothetical protein
MTAVSMNIMARVKAVAANARSAKVMINRATKRDTLDDARAKVIAKLKLNVDYFNGAITEQVDLVYKKQSDDTYAIGIKYGNRYLDGLFEGRAFVEGVSKDEVVAMLDTFAECVEQGICDAAITAIMQNNVSARNKKAH